MQQTAHETDYLLEFLPTLRILSYHSVSNLAGSPLAKYGIPPDRFEHQIRALIETGYAFLDPENLIDVLTGRMQIISNSILITFDDCYRDFLSNALPILRRYQIKAIIFPLSRLIGGYNAWDNRLGAPRLELLDAEELLRIQAEGIAIGSHTRTHRRLNELSEPDLIDEIKGSLNDLTALGLNPLPILAYPYGIYNEHVKKIAQTCGIQAAFTVSPGIVQVKGDAFQVPRIEILPDNSGVEFLKKVACLTIAKKKLRLNTCGPESGRHDLWEASDVTLVMLSCARYDLLDATVRSFFRINEYPIKQVLISDDSGDPEAVTRLQEIFRHYNAEVTFFIQSRGRGISACKDILYSNVRTEFIMHLEDDWLCTSTSGDFIRRAKEVLSANPNILQVWLRPPYDCNGHPLEDAIKGSEYARFALLKTGHRGKWHGYSDNPNLRRKREYLLLGTGGYSSMDDSGAAEAAIGQFYFERSFRAAVLVEPDAGFIHIGGTRSIASTPTGTCKRWPSPKSMSELHADLSHALQQKQDLADQVQELRERFARLTDDVRERDAQLEQLRGVLADRDRAISEPNAQVGRFTESIALPYNSISWRITAPLKKRLHRELVIGWSMLRTLASRFRHRLRERADVRLITSASMFDRLWYLQHNPDVRAAGIHPALHYLRYGAQEGRDPSAYFDSDWYLEKNPDVAKVGLNPLVHFLQHGAREGRAPKYDIHSVATAIVPRFSILMANYNNGRYIDQAIRSVLAQTFADWEMIIIDDASKDDSLERIEPYLGDRRIRLYVREENEGYTKALIYGLTKVSSEIVGILDSDDALVPEAIEKVHRVHVERPERGLVLSQLIRCDSNLKPLLVDAPHREWPLLWLTGGTHFRTFKLSAYNKTAGLDPRLRTGQDWDLVFKLEEVAPAHRIPEPLYMYRYLSSSASQAPVPRHRGRRSLALSLYRAYLRRQHTSLPNMPQSALLAWLAAGVEYSLDLREPWQALSCASRGLRIAPFDGAAWRIVAKSVRACMGWLVTSPKVWKVGGETGYVMLRSYPVRDLGSHTGNREADRIVCIPMIHRKGYCGVGGNYLVAKTGRYNVTFEITVDAYSFAQDPLAVLDVFETFPTKTVLAERKIRSADLAGRPRSFNIVFYAKEEQRLDFRVYWNEQCFLTVNKVVLQKATESEFVE